MNKEQIEAYLNKPCVMTWSAMVWTGDEYGHPVAVGKKVSRHALVPFETFTDKWGTPKVRVQWWGAGKTEVLSMEIDDGLKDLYDQHLPIKNDRAWDGTFSIKLVCVQKIAAI